LASEKLRLPGKQLFKLLKYANVVPTMKREAKLSDQHRPTNLYYVVLAMLMNRKQNSHLYLSDSLYQYRNNEASRSRVEGSESRGRL